MRRTIALVALLALPALAGFKDGVYTSASNGVRVAFPKGWKFDDKNTDGGRVVQFESPDGSIKGALLHTKDGKSPKEMAKSRGAEWEKKAKTVTWESEEKLADRKPGEWLKVVYSLESDDGTWVTTHVFVANGKDNYELLTRVAEDPPEAAQKTLDAIAASLELGEFKEEPGDDPVAPPDDGTKPPVNPPDDGTKKPVNPPDDGTKPPVNPPDDGTRPPATAGPVWADADRGVALRGAPGWKMHTSDFKMSDQYLVAEWDTGHDKVFFGLSETPDAGLDAKTWADTVMNEIGKSFENLKQLEGTAPKDTERRDFRAETGGKGIRFVYVFFLRGKKAYYIQSILAEDQWEANKAEIDGAIATLAQGDVAGLAEEMKKQQGDK